MKAITKLSKPEANLLRNFAQSGGVIEHILIDATGEKGPTEELHRRAAALTLKTLQRKCEIETRAIQLQFKIDTPSRRMTYTTVGMTGAPVTVEQFLGPYIAPQVPRM